MVTKIAFFSFNWKLAFRLVKGKRNHEDIFKASSTFRISDIALKSLRQINEKMVIEQQDYMIESVALLKYQEHYVEILPILEY